MLSGTTDWSPQAETLLHFAARAEHIARTIRPALAAGTWVVCDRFYDSTMAYQGYAQNADKALIRQLISHLDTHPDLTIILDVDAELSASRLAARGASPDRYEREGATFQRAVIEAFRSIAAANPERCVLIPADGTPQTVHNAIMDVIHQRL